MMQGADVVQAIFRTLGIDGWETAGMEPADAAIPVRAWEPGGGCAGPADRRGPAVDVDRAGASGGPEPEIAPDPCLAEDGAR